MVATLYAGSIMSDASEYRRGMKHAWWINVVVAFAAVSGAIIGYAGAMEELETETEDSDGE